MESVAIIVNGWELLTNFTKLSILNAYSGPDYTSSEHNPAHFRVVLAEWGLNGSSD